MSKAVSLVDSPDAEEDCQDNSCYSQSSRRLLETSSQPFLSEEDDETQAEITMTKIVFPKDMGLV